MIGGEYDGELKDGVREGRGKLTWSNGDSYEGEFKNGLRHGMGVFIETNGRNYRGQWALSMREGEGSEFWKNGDEYKGILYTYWYNIFIYNSQEATLEINSKGMAY
jgi:hypothetical protein